MDMTLLKDKIVRILGIDPGLQRMGWGIIEMQGNHVRHIDHGIIRTDAKENVAQRLAEIARHLQGILDAYSPTEAAVEETFVNQNPVSTLKLGMARGIGLMIPASRGLSVFEYGANHIKKMVVGVGHADKTQVTMMVRRLLPLAGNVDKDAADALAVALCHSHARTVQHRLGITP